MAKYKANKLTLKSGEDLKNLRVSCARVAEVVRRVAAAVKPGVSTGELNELAYKLIIANEGDVPAFLNYQPYGADYPFPGSICISVNEEVVHGIANHEKILKEGDIVGLDCGIKHKGMISDHAVTVAVGKIAPEIEELLEVTKNALKAGIKAAKIGNYVNDISVAIQAAIPKRYGIVKILSGHGVGYKVHEEPYVPNFDDKVKGPKLVEGMVLAIEPMVNMGTDDVEVLRDGYTFVTADGKYSAHFEHTVLIGKDSGEILTI